MIIILARKNLDYASQAPLHPGYASCGPNDDHGQKSNRGYPLTPGHLGSKRRVRPTHRHLRRPAGSTKMR